MRRWNWDGRGGRGSDEGEKMEGVVANLWGGVGVFRLRFSN